MIVVSDGWDRGDPALVASETARLRRNCHRLVWLNPLAGTPGYQPLAGGMRAAFPYIDDFLPAGTVASLERLGEILGGVRSADTRRGAEAAAHAALPGVTDLTAVGPPSELVGGAPTDPSTRGRSDEGTARHPGRPGKGRASTPGAPWSSARSVPRRDRKARCCCTPRTGGSPDPSAAAASRGRRPRRSSTPERPATPA